MFKLLSINVRGLGDPRKSSSLFQLFEKFASDIIFVQEKMACRSETISFLSRLWPGRSFWSPALGRQGGGGGGGGGGLAVLFSKNCDAEVLSWRRDSDGRILSLLIKLDERPINFVNIYVPVVLSDRKEFINNLHEFFFSWC